MDGAQPVAKRTRSRKHEAFKKQRRIQEQTRDLGLGYNVVVLDDVDENVPVDEKDVVVETECITIEDSDEDSDDSNTDEEEVDEDDDDYSNDDDEEEEEGEEYVTDNTNSEESEDDMVDQGGMKEGGKNEEFPKEADLVTGDEQDRENIMVEVDPSGEESEDDMLDQGGVNEEGKNEEVPKEADAVTGDEQDKGDIMVAVDPEENEDRLANGEVKPNSKNIGKLGKGKKKRGLTGTNDVDSKTALGNRMAKMDKSMGMIFMCNSKTKKDCYRHKVFGLPAGKKEMVLKIKSGMKLFLFNYDLKLLYGIYKAAGPGGYSIEPTAFGSGFPSQVRFEVYEDCVPLPEEKFKRVIKDNYYQKNKFDFQLTSEQVKNLCKLFRASSKGSRLHGIGRAETHALMDRERNRNECYRVIADRHADYRVEPYRNLDQDWMVRNRPLREVPYRNVDHHRRAREQEKQHTSSVRDILYEESLDPYKREVLHPPSYAYEEEMNAYRREPLYEEGRGLFFDMESRRREQIERRVASLPQHHDRPFLDAEFRHHQVSEHHDHQVLYRPILNEPSYAASTPREYHTTRYAPYHTNLQPEY